MALLTFTLIRLIFQINLKLKVWLLIPYNIFSIIFRGWRLLSPLKLKIYPKIFYSRNQCIMLYYQKMFDASNKFGVVLKNKPHALVSIYEWMFYFMIKCI